MYVTLYANNSHTCSNGWIFATDIIVSARLKKQFINLVSSKQKKTVSFLFDFKTAAKLESAQKKIFFLLSLIHYSEEHICFRPVYS